MKKFMQYLIILSLILIAAGSWWFFTSFCEGEKPVLRLSEPIDIIGQRKTFDIIATDNKTGLRNILVTLSQDDKKYTLYAKDLATKGIKERTCSIEINSKDLNLHDGIAWIKISAIDYSIHKNTATLDIRATIDVTPPQIYLFSSAHYINPGGTCIAIYNVSETVIKSGVSVGDNFFPGYPTSLAGKDRYIACFALPLDAKTGNTRVQIVARDRAGNESLIGLPCYIKNKKFRKDSVNITDNFLELKMPEFQRGNDSLAGATPLEIFQYVNRQERIDNFRAIQTICGKSEARQLWQGHFLRMEKAATTAQFGDRRTYYYKGRAIGKSNHMGVDLASTKNAGVAASNSGIVVFTGYLGIYGNTVIIDHGLGISSLYGHMGAIKVKKGQMVTKGEQIGHTDTSGLAGGDHLHFSILVGGRFVDPREWWDPHWINDNWERKLAEAS